MATDYREFIRGKIRAAGWLQRDWCDDCAALLGVSRSCVVYVVCGNNWQRIEENW